VTKGDYWDGVADAWDSRRDRLWRAHSDALNIALCRRWLSDPPARRLLKTDLFDEAAGVGLWPRLADLACRVNAIDISHAVARRARTQHPIAAVTADVRHLPFPDRAFDTIVSNSTLDHFDDPGSIADGLRDLYRVLDRDGRLLLTLDNGANPAVAIRNALPQGFLSTVGLIPYRMGRTLLPRAASDLLTKVGFAVLQRTAIMHTPRVAIIPVLRLFDRPSGRGAGAHWLRVIERFEIAERWPTRFLTGHFIALLAIKR
jgi:SAM-dependent methyltransferase